MVPAGRAGILQCRGRIEEDNDVYRKLFSLIVFLGLVIGLGASADAFERIYIYHNAPVIYAPAPAVVAFDPDERFTGAYDIQGVVTYSEPFHMTVRIHDQQYPVNLHQGTIIRPTGITLEPSMVVNVAGYWSDGVFYANRIAVLRY